MAMKGSGMSKRVGDGTGMGSMPETKEGLSHVDGDEANSTSAPYSPKDGGHPKHEGPQRTNLAD